MRSSEGETLLVPAEDLDSNITTRLIQESKQGASVSKYKLQLVWEYWITLF